MFYQTSKHLKMYNIKKYKSLDIQIPPEKVF